MENEWTRLPVQIREQIAKLQSRFGTDPSVVEKKKAVIREFSGSGNDDIALKLAIFDHFNTKDLLKKRFFDIIQPFEIEGRYVKLSDIIHQGERVMVAKGVLYNDIDRKKPAPVIVKYYQSADKDTSYEINIYKRLREMGAEIPWISSRFYMWKTSVLIMEPMESLDGKDNEFEVAAQVLQQLQYLHTFCTHNDLKPGNIMRVSGTRPNMKSDASKTKTTDRNEKPKTTDKPVYKIIDHGGNATEKLKHGYRRRVWSPKFCAQSKHGKDQVTTAKHDFIELGYTMKALQNMRTGDKEIRGGFAGRLAEFMQRVKKVDEKNIKPEDYLDLIALCRK
jgi:serine/threonine protein kinase